MEKWHLAGIFAAQPRMKLDLTNVYRPHLSPPAAGAQIRQQPTFLGRMKAVCRKLPGMAALF